MKRLDDWDQEGAMPLTDRSAIRSPFGKLPVLLFDPNPVAAGILTMQLRRAGFETHMTVDGAAAVATARGQQFASIVVVADLADAQMRKCLHELRDAEPDAWLIVISDPPVDRSRDGGNAVMDVPFTVSDLAHRLSALPARGPLVA
jgi:DNA-binding response OmpR family regulator